LVIQIPFNFNELTKNNEGNLVVMDIDTFVRREKMLELREELLGVKEDILGIAGRIMGG
jgi:hypothetical protein